MSNDLQKRLSRIDLNLLPVLLVLIETRSTQATAERIGRTQSAVSHALKRLRETLNDPLFIRHGPQLIATPLLLELHQPLTELLNNAALLVNRGHAFDPASSDRQVVIGCPDLVIPLADAICEDLAAQAPGMTFRITGNRHGNSRLRAGELDMLISLYRNQAEPGQSMSHVSSASWAFYTSPELSPVNQPPAAEDWAQLPHVQVYTGPDGRSPVDDAAQLAGISREITLQVDGFLEALYVASRGRASFTTFPVLVGPVANTMGLIEHRLPFSVPAAPVSLITRGTEFEPLSRWLHSTARSTLETRIKNEHKT